MTPAERVRYHRQRERNHVRGVRSGWVIGTARPLHRGKTTQLWEIRITDAADKLVCISRLTMAVLEKSTA